MIRNIFVAATFAAFATSASADDLQQSVFAAWFAEIEHLDNMCGVKKISEAGQDALLSAFDVDRAQFEKGGALFGSHLYASTNAFDKFADLGPRDHCYHLSLLFGLDGYLLPNILEDE